MYRYVSKVFNDAMGDSALEEKFNDYILNHEDYEVISVTSLRPGSVLIIFKYFEVVADKGNN